MRGRCAFSLGVHREQEGHGVVGAGAREAGDGGGERLEVEVAHRRLQPGEGGVDVAVHDGAALAHRAPDDALERGEGDVVGDGADVRDARGFERRAAFGPEARELVDGVLGPDVAAGAVRMVRTGVGGEAVRARCDARCIGTGEHRLHLAHQRVDAVDARHRLVEHRVRGEQRVEVESGAVVDVAAVESEHRGVAHIKPRAAHGPELHGDIEHESLL